jgi:hypothetical protein
VLQATFVLLWSTERIASGDLPPASIFDVLRRLLRVCVDFAFSASAKRGDYRDPFDAYYCCFSSLFIYAKKLGENSSSVGPTREPGNDWA